MGFRKIDLAGLRSEVKRLAEEGRAMNPVIASSRGLERHEARERKAGIGQSARAALLAYALLRGVPYTSLERRTRDEAWQTGWLTGMVASYVKELGPTRPPGEDLKSAVSEWMKAGREAP